MKKFYGRNNNPEDNTSISFSSHVKETLGGRGYP